MDPLKFKTWPIDKLVEYEGNPRKNDHAVERVAAAIKEFGFRVPVIATSDGAVIDGHLRLKAARHLGMPKIPVVLADDLTETQIKAFRLSVNKVAELADWDDGLLKLELKGLADVDFDLSLTGFDDVELVSFLAVKPEADPDEVPEVAEKAVTVQGDTWLLGAYFECEKCGKKFAYEDGKKLGGECGCDKDSLDG